MFCQTEVKKLEDRPEYGAVKRALISVSDKTGAGDFALGLARQGVELISTGGTAKLLRDSSIAVKEVSEVTGFPEALDGRVKTLHPKIHGGLLFRRDLEAHRAAAQELGIGAIDLICINLYPFEKTLASGTTDLDEIIENIDIGGPAMIRAACKNWEFVTVVTDPADYGAVLEELVTTKRVSRATRARLAAKAFRRTAAYDAAIAGYMQKLSDVTDGKDATFPGWTNAQGELRAKLRYGENPHQIAGFYRTASAASDSLANARVLGGKEISYNNLLDADAAWGLVRDLARLDSRRPWAIAFIKHTNPCGAAIGGEAVETFARALSGDPVSAFGGIVAISNEVSPELGKAIAENGRMLEVIIAPSFSAAAVEAIQHGPKWGANVRLLEMGPIQPDHPTLLIRSVSGGFLVQSADDTIEDMGKAKVVTAAAPDAATRQNLAMAWLLAKHCKSNAITLVKDFTLVGAGCGQMSRVDSVKIACQRAGDRARGAALGSDAFFPFPDGIEEAAKAGVASAVEPGGSVKDKDVVAAADRLKMAMLFTGVRHFRH
ncbi:MAG: bifunctional phosphoribosylaminoimidazolecarboxamide formyltransferase/IMP cyclohydrolase [Planctomycetota bacterium]